MPELLARLSGLAAGAGFFVAVFLTGALDLEKRLLLVCAAAPVLGAIADLAFRPTRAAGFALGIGFGAGAFWIFYSMTGLLLYILAAAVIVAGTVACCVLSQHEPLRAAAAGVGLGLAVGITALLGGATLLGWWSFGLAAGCAGFLLVALVLGKRVTAGTSLTLSIGVIGALMAAAVALQRWFPWYYAALFALVPLAVRLPLPQHGAGAQAAVGLGYALAMAGGICAFIELR